VKLLVIRLIQSNFGTKGNFEALVTYNYGKLHHWTRNNDSANPDTAWIHGNNWQPIVSSGRYVSLIQSNFGTKGNFEALVTYDNGKLHHWTRNNDSANPDTAWIHGNNGRAIKNTNIDTPLQCSVQVQPQILPENQPTQILVTAKNSVTTHQYMARSLLMARRQVKLTFHLITCSRSITLLREYGIQK